MMKVGCPGGERCPLKELAERSEVSEIEIIHIHQPEQRSKVNWAILALLIVLAMVLGFFAVGRADAQNTSGLFSLQQHNDQQDERINNIAAKIDKLEFRADANHEEIVRLSNRQLEVIQELGRIEGIGSGLIAVIIVLQFLGIRGKQPAMETVRMVRKANGETGVEP